MTTEELTRLLQDLTALPHETEWVEFKKNKANPEEIGEYLSAIANSAALHDQSAGFIVWGIQDKSHKVVGSTFRPKLASVGGQELENWLATLLHPSLNFKIYELDLDGRHIVMLKIPPATHTPVRFKDYEYIRVGSYTKKLRDHPEKERELWALFSKTPFEAGVAMRGISADQVLTLIDYPAYFDLIGQLLPDNRHGILDRLTVEKLITKRSDDTYHITNLGAILFAKDLETFDELARKVVRVVVYKGTSRIETLREQVERRGACYLHACLRHVSNDKMTNTSLRERFAIKDKNYPMASRIIADTIEAGLLRKADPESKSKKNARYVPFWA